MDKGNVLIVIVIIGVICVRTILVLHVMSINIPSDLVKPWWFDIFSAIPLVVAIVSLLWIRFCWKDENCTVVG